MLRELIRRSYKHMAGAMALAWALIYAPYVAGVTAAWWVPLGAWAGVTAGAWMVLARRALRAMETDEGKGEWRRRVMAQRETGKTRKASGR